MMIKITSMTADGDNTGCLSFTFDSPEDLARLWSLGVEVTGNDTINIMVSSDMEGNWRAKADDLTSHVYDGPLPPQPPIPPNVYYSLGNFYDKEKRQGMGMEFAKTWIDRKDEFPQGHDK